eukprot:TRINITY_DN2542_c0_g1_i1.p2 TRINITY_DN2542_c0_g1~~TRINITY_DN2542_c0_g1_i1.p2  ORF type:complete len:176 (+),score=22.65 TRINITY_DN2542_c0_g1_i1:64-591(+)
MCIRDSTKMSFRVFKEKDLGLSLYFQQFLKQTTQDDDCATDSEQLYYAVKHCKRQFNDALTHENNRSEDKESSQEITSVTLTSQSEESQESIPSEKQQKPVQESGVMQRKVQANLKQESCQSSQSGDEESSSTLSQGKDKKSVTKKLFYSYESETEYDTEEENQDQSNHKYMFYA